MDPVDLVLLVVAAAAYIFGRWVGVHDGKQRAAAEILRWITQNPPPGGLDEWEGRLWSHYKAQGYVGL